MLNFYFNSPEGLLYFSEDVTHIDANWNRSIVDDDYIIHKHYIKKVIIPSGVKTIGAGAFLMYKMAEVILPEGLEEIEDDAFYSCSSLERIILPKSLKRIGKHAFCFCDALEDVVFHNLPLIEVGSEAFRGTPIEDNFEEYLKGRETSQSEE